MTLCPASPAVLPIRSVVRSLVWLVAMETIMHTFEVRIGDVGVDLGRGDIAMTEHGLHTAKIRPIHQ